MQLLPAPILPSVRPARPAEGVARSLYRPMAVPVRAEKPAADGGIPPAREALQSPRPVPLRPESLHPALWLGHQLGRHAESAVPSGFATLDAQLPGGGWPRRALTELLLPQPGIGEIRLLAAALVAAQKSDRLVMLFDPPAQLSATALAQLGFDVEQLLIINTRTRVIPGSDSLWALEQALKSGHVGAVLAWLPPRLRAERLRRLQLAAHAHDGPAFVLREMGAMQRPTSAPLRLALRANGADVLAVRVLKRRGPPLAAALQLALPAMLSNTAQQRARQSIEPAASASESASESGSASASASASTASLSIATFVNFALG
jgi:protein ImuA